ncbi:MAG: BREX system P-loop protein BrxC [Victivallales bacterium]|nr:BREX system P-loop protein BrxC [Victivallales bacterium]
MNKIKDILKINLTEDIKNVIDLEDRSDIEIQKEIESYIVTDNIGKHFYEFISRYTSKIEETGVWISGFYGSGKSYFGKMLGYLLSNRNINGTPARERFLPRLSGVKDEQFIINEIGKLDGHPSHLIFLDVAKQNTEQGLAFTLFKNFLSSLGFLPNIYGYIEYQLFLGGDYEAFQTKVEENESTPWKEIRKKSMKVPQVIRNVLVGWKYTEEEYEETRKYLENQIAQFDANSLRDKLSNYLDQFPDKTLVFIFDEASEAIAQKKFSLLDLEGISEALSSISRKVWTIAIAQEKLDDVINNANVSKSMLVKVTDRFKTKIHLESTEVDKIIRSRLLQKTEQGLSDLHEYFKKNLGLITDSTNLDSTFPTKTDDADTFATYYPFHRYQFNLLQEFLFSAKALTSTQVAARGMIITTFDVLRKQLKDFELHKFSTAHHLTTEAQPQPHAALVNKYDNASRILNNEGSLIDGTKLLKTIHFINEAERVNPTSENITKMYITELTEYHEIKPQIDQAIQLLVNQKILIENNHQYKITSDLETKLLDEMKEFPVELYVKKREIINYLKKENYLKNVQQVVEDQNVFPFQVRSDQQDEILGSASAEMKLEVFNIYNINEKLDDFVEKQKMKSQGEKKAIYLIPDTTAYDRIDSLLEEVKRYTYIVDKYGTDNDPYIRKITREFSLIREQKEKNLIQEVKNAYLHGHLIYLFDDQLLDKDHFNATVTATQKKLIGNLFTKRLDFQLKDDTAIKILKENQKDRLHRHFSGDDFKFFDQNGNFIGESLKVCEEIIRRIETKFIDGASLENELGKAPTGFSFGTINTTLAVLMKAGKLVVKKGIEYYSPNHEEVLKVFSNSREFKKAAFKAISKTLSSGQKDAIVQTLQDLKYNQNIKNNDDPRVDWNLNDFQMVQATVQTANYYISQISGMENSTAGFTELFSDVAAMKSELSAFTGQVTEQNYTDKADYFIQKKNRIRSIAKAIEKTQRFIKSNLVKANGMNRFVQALKIELTKAHIPNEEFDELINTFEDIYRNSLVENFGELNQTAMQIKDRYYDLMKDANASMNKAYQQVKTKAETILKEIKKYPEELNSSIIQKAERILEEATQRLNDQVELEFHIADQRSHLSLSEMQNAVELAPARESDLDVLLTKVKDQEKPESAQVNDQKQARKVKLHAPKRKITAGEYRKWLSEQIQSLKGIPNEDPLEIDWDNENSK